MKAILVFANKIGKQKKIKLPSDFPYEIRPEFITTKKIIYEVNYTELRIDTMTYYIYATKVR